MENKQSKRRWKIPVLLVSAICILLASSFIFQITADALDYDYSLQTGYFQNPIDRDGSVLSQSVDVSDFRNVSSTENNAYSSGTMNGSIDYFSPFTGEGRTAYGFEDYLYSYRSDGISYVVCATQTYQYSSGFIFYPFGYSSSNYLYDLNGAILYTASSEIYCCAYYDSFYYVLYRSGSSSHYCNVAVLNESFISVGNYRIGWTSYSYQQILLIDGGFVVFKDNAIIIFDFENRSFSTVPYKTTSSIGMNDFVAGYDGESVYMFSESSSIKSIKYVISTGSLSSFSSVTAFAPASGVRCCSYYAGSFICNTGTQIVTLQSQDYFFDFGSYIDSNIYTPDRYLNFEYKDSSSVLSGGFHVGIELEFGVSSLMFSQIALKGFEIGVTTLIAQDYMIESETTMTAPRPLNCWNGSNYITDYRTSYRYIGQRDGKYLYMCTSFCNFTTQGRLNPIKVVINCYLPYQVSSHNYSIPVSMLTFTDEYSAGGGGGESSDTSSGGGGSTSSDSSSGGTSSEDHPSDMPPEWERNSVEFWFKNQTQDFFLGTYDMWDADTLQVYFGGYAVGSMEPVPTRIRFLKNDVVTEEIRFENLVFQGWSYSSSLSSFEYPTFSGQFVAVPLESSRRIYLTDYLSYPQLFIADYGAGMLALVNFDTIDSYLTIVNSDTLETTITVNNTTPESIVIYGKVMEYSYFTLSDFVAWQPYEEGGIYIPAIDWALSQNAYAGLYLHTYITEVPPPTIDWWVEYSMELEAERSRLAELESKANQLYGDVSYDPLDDAGFVDAISSYTGIIATDAADGIFSLIQKMWSANPYFSYFVAITVGVCCCMFYLRKL